MRDEIERNHEIKKITDKTIQTGIKGGGRLMDTNGYSEQEKRNRKKTEKALGVKKASVSR